MWSIDSGDWRGLPAPAMTKNVLSRVRNGSIIIFHDSDENAHAKPPSHGGGPEHYPAGLKSRRLPDGHGFRASLPAMVLLAAPGEPKNKGGRHLLNGRAANRGAQFCKG